MQAPASMQARDRAHLRELLQVASGGVVFTTIQKFLGEEKGERHPTLSPRRNLVVIADEAHRSQYGCAYRVVWYPPTLQIRQKGRDPEHYEIFPAHPMTVEQYQAALHQVKLEREDW